MLIKEDKDLSDVLIATGRLTEDEIQKFTIDRQKKNKSLLEIILDSGRLTSDDINMSIAEYLGFEFIKLEGFEPDSNLLKKVDSVTAQQYEIFPISEESGILKIAMIDPTNLKALDDITAIIGMPVEALLADEDELRNLINQFYGASEETLEEMFADVEELEVVKEEELDPTKAEKDAMDAPIIKYVNSVLQKALKDRASDIHFEPFEKEFRVRYRIDGECRQEPSPPKKLQGAIISRLKIMSGMNIAERRIPQDGRI